MAVTSQPSAVVAEAVDGSKNDDAADIGGGRRVSSDEDGFVPVSIL